MNTKKPTQLLNEHKKKYEFYNLTIEERLKKLDVLFVEMSKGVGNVKTGKRILRNLRGI